MSCVLVFSPYLCWSHVNAYEGTIARACQMRGANVEYLLCDGALPECDQHWDSCVDYRHRPLDLCKRCQAKAKTNIAELNLSHRWLGEFVSDTEREYAFDWAQSLSTSDMLDACFMGYPLGNLVLSSMNSYFRQYPPEMSNWHVINVYRGFLFSAAIVTIGLLNYTEAHAIDSALLYNSRISLTRIAFEILQGRGIRVLTHETPFYQRGHMNVKPNARCWSIDPFTKFWWMWGKVPLTRPSLEKTLKWLIDRRYARNLTWYPFNTPFARESSLRDRLSLSHNKRLLALFTSSTDEFAEDPDLQGPYVLQSSWVEDVVNWVRDRNDVELIIRIHPNLSGNCGIGRAFDEYNFYGKMKSDLPANTRLVMPDESLNSYALTDEADICLTFGSTIGFEMAMLGKPVVLASRAIYEDMPHVLNARTREMLPEMLEKSLGSFLAREIRREAFRLAYYYVFEFEPPFPLVSMEDVLEFNLNYTSPEALSPSQDKVLDNICNYILKGTPLYDSPTEAEKARTTADEDAFFELIEQSPDFLRDYDYEHCLQRINRLRRLGKSTKNILEHMPLGTGDPLRKVGRLIYRSFLHRIERSK